MKILIACEYSGVVREQFEKRGHYVVSCDLLDSEKPGLHYKGDVRDIINLGWDLMVAHPPCTYLSYAGWGAKNKPGREAKIKEAFDFFMEMINAPIEKICVENPQGYPCQAFRKPDQVIHPYYFGEKEMKRTCLWLKGLEPLIYGFDDNLFTKKTSCEIPEPEGFYIDKNGRKKNKYFMSRFNGKRDRGYLRSRTFQSIAVAMAKQWG